MNLKKLFLHFLIALSTIFTIQSCDKDNSDDEQLTYDATYNLLCKGCWDQKNGQTYWSDKDAWIEYPQFGWLVQGVLSKADFDNATNNIAPYSESKTESDPASKGYVSAVTSIRFNECGNHIDFNSDGTFTFTLLDSDLTFRILNGNWQLVSRDLISFSIAGDTTSTDNISGTANILNLKANYLLLCINFNDDAPSIVYECFWDKELRQASK